MRFKNKFSAILIPMQKYLMMPKLQISILLFILFLVVSSLIGVSLAFFLLFMCVGFCFLFDIVFTYARKRRYFKPFAAIVTGFILALIIDPGVTWYQILIITASAMAIKNFARIGDRHLLNPAASGLLVSWALFGLQPSWWAATLYSNDKVILNVLIYVLLAGIAYVSSYKLRRWYSVVTYVGVYTILFLLITSPTLQNAIRTISSPGLLFYALLMVPEPMTSPVNKKRQMMYGVTVAVLNAAFVFASFRLGFSNIPDSSILALLIGNIIFFKLR